MIPRFIHVTWPHKNLLEDPSPLIQQGMRQLRDLNPSWVFKIYNDADIQQDLADYFTGDLRRTVEDITPFVAKVDLWRLVKMFTVGGVYADIDRLCDQRLDQLILPSVKCVLPTNQDWDFSQDIMISAPENPLYLDALNLSLRRRQSGSTDVYYLGPQTYMNAVTHALFGVELPVNPGANIMSEIRNRLKTIPWLLTYSESPPHDTVLYRAGTLDFNFVAAKHDLYHRQRVRHWETV